jgi:hypothetical protein
MSRRLILELPSTATDPNVVLRGYGSADLIRELAVDRRGAEVAAGGSRSATEADDLVALAEHRGYAVRVVDGAP